MCPKESFVGVSSQNMTALTSKEIPTAYVKHEEISLWDNESIKEETKNKIFSLEKNQENTRISWII